MSRKALYCMRFPFALVMVVVGCWLESFGEWLSRKAIAFEGERP
jgi:hypothetical protein